MLSSFPLTICIFYNVDIFFKEIFTLKRARDMKRL